MKYAYVSIFLGALAVALSSTAPAQKDATEKLRYVGVERCRSCHSSAEMGKQYQLWKKGPHAKAYETLESDGARKTATPLDIEEPQKSSKCLECHVTAFKVGPERLARAFTIKNGIGCEACHGPGEAYATLRMMRAVAGGLQDPAEIGLVTETPEKRCVSCHSDRSPTYKPFNHKEAAAKIAHPRPQTERP